MQHTFTSWDTTHINMIYDIQVEEWKTLNFQRFKKKVLIAPKGNNILLGEEMMWRSLECKEWSADFRIIPEVVLNLNSLQNYQGIPPKGLVGP